MPLLQTAASAYSLQALFALIFVPRQEDKYYDLCGAIGWMSTTCLSLYYPALKVRLWEGIPQALPPLRSFAPRQLLLSAAVGIWSMRLGTFLAQRAIKAGGDSRLEAIKKDPKRYSIFWFMQGTWIFAVGLPVWLSNAIPSHRQPPLGVRDWMGLGLFLTSFLIEVQADREKSMWRHAKKNKEHDEPFISSGLWAISRHPNYVGEVGIWSGIWLMSTSGLPTAGKIMLAGISPLLTWYLLRHVSGVPPLERAGDERYRGNAQWDAYKRRVPVFWPWLYR